MALLKIVPLTNAGSALKEIARKSKGMSGTDIRKKWDISHATLSKINTDENCTRDQIIDYAKAIGIGTPFIIFAMDEEDVKRMLNTNQ
jgi:AAA+ superfamily predicted ATPase